MPSTRASSASPPTAPAPPPIAEVHDYRARYEAARPAPVPLLGALPAWAEQNVRRHGPPVVVIPRAPPRLRGRISALLDWELTHVGDPLDDLGAAVWSCLGLFEPEDVVAGYAGGRRPRRPQAALVLPRARLRDPVGDGGGVHPRR